MPALTRLRLSSLDVAEIDPELEELIAREGAHWDPVLFWAKDALGAHFILAQGIVHVGQPETAVAAARAALPADPWLLGALHVVTTITGSALLALALHARRLDPAEVWAAAHVDEDFNIEQWGLDDEVGLDGLDVATGFESGEGGVERAKGDAGE